MDVIADCGLSFLSLYFARVLAVTWRKSLASLVLRHSQMTGRS